ncbi:hypothetical protein GCM10011391_00160 [Pullulanibacillus camelliae]|uniref:Pycsar effector protein domain-containing protein n=1 Tax=Pullulanibacillus camelliae TaxID=1707096 RepID=A0A8J2VDD6_9BACL|nr:hypothetical protein [Pullulanibacillus camelliae]GGE25747.1 hypothetical protein GCM10011391_00160 [Pullulanibacillus camelliae]
MDEKQERKFFDLRRLIGLLLTIYGILIGGYGLFVNPQSASVSFNIDLWWGILLLVIGIIFLLLSLRPENVRDDDSED